MRIYNQTLLALCLNDTVLFLNTYDLFLQGSYQMKLHKSQQLGLVNAEEAKQQFYLELNRDYLVLYQQSTERFHLYQFNSTGELDYLGFPNVSSLFGQKIEIRRMIFPYEDQSEYTRYIAVLVPKEGVLVLYADPKGTVQFVGAIDPNPYGELYLDLYRETYLDVDESILYLVSNNFIIVLEVSFSPTEATA